MRRFIAAAICAASALAGIAVLVAPHADKQAQTGVPLAAGDKSKGEPTKTRRGAGSSGPSSVSSHGLARGIGFDPVAHPLVAMHDRPAELGE